MTLIEQNYLKACWTIADPGGRAGTCSQIKKNFKNLCTSTRKPTLQLLYTAMIAQACSLANIAINLLYHCLICAFVQFESSLILIFDRAKKLFIIIHYCIYVYWNIHEVWCDCNLNLNFTILTKIHGRCLKPRKNKGKRALEIKYGNAQIL